jgi:large subunit ribosomal protein L22
MGLYKYSIKAQDEKKVSRAQAYDLDVSYKDLCNVCFAITNKSIPVARKILNEAIEMKMPIIFQQFNTGVGHRSQLGGRKGRFPKKECKVALATLNNAVANATRKGLDESLLVVQNANANKQNVLPRYRRTFVGGAALGYGKQAIRSDYVTARMEITLTERPGLKPIGKKDKNAAKAKQPAKADKATAAPHKAEEKKGA